MTPEELQKDLENDLNITEDNIQEKSLSLARIYQKYLKLLTSEKLQNDKIEKELKELYGKLYHELKVKGYDGYEIGKNKNEVEIYVSMNEYYRKLESKVIMNHKFIEHIELALKNISSVSFNIKNYIDLKKLKLGIT